MIHMVQGFHRAPFEAFINSYLPQPFYSKMIMGFTFSLGSVLPNDDTLNRSGVKTRIICLKNLVIKTGINELIDNRIS